MIEAIAGLLLIGAGFFAFVAGLGVLRLGDLPSRMHAATKASGAAFALILLAVCLRTPSVALVVKSIVALGFAFLTLPVAAHLLGRSSLSRRESARPPSQAPASPEPPEQGELSIDRSH